LPGLVSIGLLFPLLAAAAAQSPAPRATLIQSPRLFAVWQAWDVLFPYALRDERSGRYLLYYTGTGVDSLSEAAWDFWSTGLVTSDDGARWQDMDDYAPVLAPRSYREGQVVDPEERLSRFDSVFAFGAVVIKDSPGYRMWYTGWNGAERANGDAPAERVGFRIGSAESQDGRQWKKTPGEAGGGAVLSPGPGAEDAAGVGQPFVRRDGGGYSLWYEGFDGRTWRLFRATSRDGQRWAKQGVALDPGPPGSLDERGARNPVVIRRRDRFEMWYQGRSRGAPEFHVLRAQSPDGVQWTKLPGEVSFHVEPRPTGSEAIHVDSVLVEPDGSCVAFFAVQSPATVPLGEDLGGVRRLVFRIYSERVDP
jgi:hypothetical protein